METQSTVSTRNAFFRRAKFADQVGEVDGVDTKHRHQRQAPGVVIKQRCPSSFTIGRRLAIVKPAVPSTTQSLFKSPMLWSVSVVACTETDPGTSPRSADEASTESC